MKIEDKVLCEHVLNLLRGGGAHITPKDVLTDFPVQLRGKKLADLPYTPWQLLEHMRIAQWDILEFSRDPEFVSPQFPEDYWPKDEAPPEQAAWDKSVKAFHSDLKAMEKLVADSSTDLLAKIPHGDGQTILREALVLADHNAYHLGQLVMLRRLLGAWDKEFHI